MLPILLSILKIAGIALLALLGVICLLVFTVLPIIFMVLIAFTNYDYQHLPPSKLFDWVGFKNFGNLFSIAEGTGFFPVFLRVLAWTFVWAFIATFTNYFLGMILALMINKKGIRLKMLSGEKGRIRRRPTSPQSMQVNCFGIFRRRSRSSITASTIQPAVILILRSFKKTEAIMSYILLDQSFQFIHFFLR